MAVSGSHGGSGSGDFASSGAVSSAWTPTSNALVLLYVTTYNPVTPVTVSSVTHTGLNFVEIENTTRAQASGVERLTVLRAMGASPSSYATSVTFSGEAEGWTISVNEFTGVDTSGTDGSGAVGDTDINSGSGTSTSMGTALSFSSANNGTAHAALVGNYNSGTPFITADGSLTELSETLRGSFGASLSTSWESGNDTTPSSSWSTGTDDWIGHGLEVVAAATGTSETPPSGSLNLTGVAPSVTFQGAIEQLPPIGALNLNGFAPNVANVGAVVESPGQGYLTLTSTTPDIAIVGNVSAAPPAGSLNLTSFAPQTSQLSLTLEIPSAGTLTLTGFAPQTDIVGNAVGEVPAGQLRLVSFNPNVNNPLVAATEKAKAGGGKRYKRRTVIIGGQRYAVENQYQLLLLLEQYRQEQMDDLVQEVIKDKDQRKIKLIASRIKRTETRIKQAGGNPWEEEEELLLMLA